MLRWGQVPAKCSWDSKSRGWHGLLPGSQVRTRKLRSWSWGKAGKGQQPDSTYEHLTQHTARVPQCPVCHRALGLFYTYWGLARWPHGAGV